jgi:predicted component of type VI protein secretion system
MGGPLESRFRITLLSQLGPRRAYATSGAPPLRAFQVDATGVDGLLLQIPVALRLEVADPLGPSGARIRVDLHVDALKALRPDGLAERLAPVRALAAARGVVQELARRTEDRSAIVSELGRVLPSAAWAEALAPAGDGPRPSARPAIATATPRDPGPAPAGSAVDALLERVDVQSSVPAGASPAPPHPKAAAFSSLISEVARGAATRRPPGWSAVALERIDRACEALLAEVLDHPEVRRLERAWRGLRFLLGEATGPVEVEVVPLDEANLAEALAYLAERPDEIVGAPDLLVLDVELALTPAALAALELPGMLAERLRAPLVVGAREGELLESAEATEALRQASAAPFAPWIVIACNGALLRGPYTAETSRLRQPRFAQEPSAAGARCFAPAPFVLAALSARAFRSSGWPSAIAGPEAGALSGFDVHGVVVGGESTVFATERLVTLEGARKHAARGLVALVSVPNRDAVICAGAPTLACAAAQITAAPTLADQLFAARVGAAVAELGASIPAGTPARAAEEVVQIALAELFPRHGSGLPAVSTRVTESGLVVTVEPRRFAGTSIGELTFEAPLSG